MTLTARPLVEATTPGTRVAGWLALVWMGGVALLLTRCGLALGLLPLVRRRLQPVRDTELLALAKEVRERLGMKRTPELRQGSVASPMTFGLFRPVVCLPEQFVAEFSPEQQRAVLAHELAHVASLDAVWRCLGEVLAALLWWHPAVWLVRRRLHSACESAADEASCLTGPVQGSLAEALVALAARPGRVAPWPVLAAAGDGYHSDLGQRVERLLENPDGKPGLPKAGWRWSGGAMAIATALVCATSACRIGGNSPAKQLANAARGKGEVPTSSPAATNLITRTFRLNLGSFRSGLDNVVGFDWTNRLAQLAGVATNKASARELMRLYLTRAGLDLTPPKALFFNEANGLMLVRGTEKDLHDVQAALDVLGLPASQVTLEAKWLEITEAGLKAMGDVLPALRPYPAGPNALTPWRPPAGGTNDMIADVAELSRTNANIRFEKAGSELATILTPAKTAAFLKAAENPGAADILSAPRVTTLDGRQAQIAVLDLRTVLTGASIVRKTEEAPGEISYETRAIPFGPTLDIVPYVAADGVTIELTTMATVSEFLGYEDPGPYQPKDEKTGISGHQPLPRMRSRWFQAHASVKDGQTLMLGGVKSTKDEEVEAADGTKTQQKVTKHLFVLITPTLIDPAGNRIHGDADRAENQ